MDHKPRKIVNDLRLISLETNLAYYKKDFVLSALQWTMTRQWSTMVIFKRGAIFLCCIRCDPIPPHSSVQRLAHTRNVTTCCSHPRKFGNHVTDRPSNRPSSPQAYQCLVSHFLATLGADCTSMLSSIDSCQNSWPVSPDRIAGSGVEVEYFLKLSADNLFVFKW